MSIGQKRMLFFIEKWQIIHLEILDIESHHFIALSETVNSVNNC